MRRTSPNRLSRPRNSLNLQAAVDQLLLEHLDILSEKQLVVDIDLIGDASTSDCGDDLLHTLERMLDLAIDRCTVGGEINVSALRTARGLEIEVADSGSQSVEFPRRLAAFHASQLKEIPDRRGSVSPRETSASEFEFFCARCPQGGLAWTVVKRWRMLAEKAA